MIKGLTGTCGVTVSGGNNTLPYIVSNSENPMTGMLRIRNTDIEVFNGLNWQQLPTSYATVSVDQEVLDVIQWARTRRDEESNWYTLASSNEAVRIALLQLDQAKTRLQLTAILAREHETNN